MTMLQAQPAPAGLMDRLRAETRAQHEHAESRPLEQALICGTLPRALFVRMLAQRLLIHQALEKRLLALRGVRPELAGVIREELFQEANLRADLADFGANIADYAPLPATAQLLALIERFAGQRPEALLGVLYVFEGSKNGARIIARRLRSVYLPEGGGMRYLDPHGDAQRALWLDFRQRMDACAFAAGVQDELVRAAQQTFECISALDDALFTGAAD
jgi:heme oxygenase